MNIKNNILDFRLDYLVTYWIFLFEEEYFDKLNFENSSTSQFWEYGILKTQIPRHQYKIIFSYWNNVVFAYEKWETASQWGVKSYDKIIVYWTWFKTLPQKQIHKFLKNNFSLTHNQRIDICADVNIDIEEILKHVDLNVLKDREEKVRDRKVATQYIWNRDKYSNKRYLIRIYNKLLDIFDKNKLWLYKDYLPEKFVTRCEVEVRAVYAKNIHWESLFDDAILRWVFINFFSKFTPLFNFIKEEKIPLLHPYNVDEENFQSFAYDEEKRKLKLKLNNLIWRARSLEETWFDIISILIFEWIKSKIIERALWDELIQKIVNEQARQKNIAGKRHYKRKIASHLGAYE